MRFYDIFKIKILIVKNLILLNTFQYMDLIGYLYINQIIISELFDCNHIGKLSGDILLLN